MAASRLLGAAAARVILLSFAAGHRKLYWSGRPKAAIVTCQQIFETGDFPFKIIFEKCSKSFFLRRRDPGSGAAISDAVAHSSILFCNSVFANRIVMAASRLLGAAAACVILLAFAAGHRTSYWSGCIKAAIVICQHVFSV